jgi:hypothetical protein
MKKDSEVSAEEEQSPKLDKLSFTIPQTSSSNKGNNKPINPKTQKLDVKIKREPKKTADGYLEILKKLDILLNQPFLSEAKRNDYCKSQRYFMKLYLRLLEENK